MIVIVIYVCLDRKKCENSEGNSSDVFGALLQEDHCPANVKSSNQMKPKWPIKIDDNCKLIQNDHITDFFIINGEAVILMGSNDSIKLQMLTAVHNGMQCRTLLEILFQKPNSFMKYPLKLTYTNIIEQKGNPSKGSGIIELKRDLFCSLFSLRNALQKSLIFICGEQSGRVSICPFAIGSQEAVTYYSDAIDIFCDMGQPLLMVLPANIKEFCVFGMETISTRNKDAVESSIASIKETLKSEDILVLIGSEGKIIIAMVPVKECMMSMFSMCHVSGPIVSGSILDDVLVYATHGSLHLSKLSVSLHVGDQQKLAISPSFKPVYSIMLPVTCISKHLISSPIRDSGINFYCADAEGWALGVMIDNTTDNMCRSDPTLNINFLLKTLENLQTDCNRWESLLKKQNSTLEELQVAASLTTAILDGTKRDDKITSQMSKSAVYCGFDSVSMGTDGVLYLDIRVHNNSDYVLPSNWFLQFAGEARQTTSNFQHGNLKQFSKVFSLYSLHPKTEMQIKSSINVKELQVTLPIEIEFKLAIPFHELGSTAEEPASKHKKSYSILPLNSCIVTVLDILHLSDGQCPNERTNTADSLCHSYHFGLPCHFCYLLPACSSFDKIPNSCKKLSSNNLTIFSVPSLAVKSLLQDENPEDFVKIIMAHLFPYNSHTSVLKYGTSLQLKLPCKQQARLSLVFDANNGKNSSPGVPRVQLEGCCLSLLLAIHSAILNRFKVCIYYSSFCTFHIYHLKCL